MDTIEGRISSIIVERIVDGQASVQVDSTTPLLSSGLSLDSVAVLELIMEIETEFGVEFKDNDLSVELLRTVGSLAHAVREKRLAAGLA